MTIRTYVNGQVTDEAVDVTAEAIAARNLTRADLLSRVDAALTADLAYLDLATPTTAQAVAQVARLTRQVVALLRVVGERLDSTTGA